jgi:hypothetical protein
MNIKALFEPSGQEFIQKNSNADIRELALKAQGKFDLPLGFLLDQINGRQKAKKKLPTWYESDQIVYPIDLSMQQCSSEISAELKTKDIPNGQICIDLGGGFGVDTYYLAKKFTQVIYVEQDKDLCDIVKHNCEILGLKNVKTVNNSVDEFIATLQITADLIYIDPARRDENQNRTVQFQDCSPNILEIKDTLKERASNLLIKASPVIDIRLAFEQFPGFKGVQIVGINNECKEVVFQTSEDLSAVKCSHHTLGELQEYTFDNVKQVTPSFSEVENYIYEPNVTIRKAQKQDEFAEQFGLKKLFKNGSLFTSTKLKEKFSGRIFKVEKELKSKKEIQKLKNAEVISKNYPSTAADLKKKYKLGASSSQFVIAFTDYLGEKKMLLCSKK